MSEEAIFEGLLSPEKIRRFEECTRLRVAACRNSVEAMAFSIVWSRSGDPAFKAAGEKVAVALSSLREAERLLGIENG